VTIFIDGRDTLAEKIPPTAQKKKKKKKKKN